MYDIQFNYKIDLIVQLVDTTTGAFVDQRQVKFLKGGKQITFLEKREGFYILLNYGKEDMDMVVEVEGYIPAKVRVCYDDLPEKYPIMEIPMIPIPKTYGYVDLLTLEGTLPGIEAIDAIALNQEYAKVAGYVEKKQVLKLFIARYMEEQAYAIVYEGQMEFEEFKISKKIDKLSLKLKEPLKRACKPEQVVNRIVRGITEESGKYLLRVREDAEGTEYLVRYVVNGETKYRRIAFSNPEDRRLE